MKDKYKVASNAKVKECKRKTKQMKHKVKKMELRSRDRFGKFLTKSKLRVHSQSKKEKVFGKKKVVKVEKIEKKKLVKKEEKSVKYDKENKKERLLDVEKYLEDRWKTGKI